MGFLHKLWDETLAGPAPETGLGKLRKFDSFSGNNNSAVASASSLSRSCSTVSNRPADQEMFITRSITILKTNSNLKNLNIDSPGSSSSSPRTPFSRS